MYPNYGFPSFHYFPLCPHLCFPPDQLPPFPFRKEQAWERYQLNTVKQDTTRQGKSPDMKTGQGNLIRRKEYQDHSKE